MFGFTKRPLFLIAWKNLKTYPVRIFLTTSSIILGVAELDATVSALIETVPSKNRKLITTHESLGYLEARYGVEVLTTIIPSLSSADEISPSQLVGVLDVIEDNDVKIIFVESEAPSVYAETIAEEANIKTVTGLWVETLRENQVYTDWLTEQVELIVENLVDLP